MQTDAGHQLHLMAHNAALTGTSICDV